MTRTDHQSPVSDREQEQSWDYIGGEHPDGSTQQALRLAHRAAQKFPDLAKRYRAFAGTAAVVSGALVALAGVAVARRVRRGQQPEEILEEITPEEIERAATASSRHNRWWRLVLRVARRRRSSEGEADEERAPGAL